MRINTSQGHGLNDEELCSKSKCPTHKFASERKILKVLGMKIRMQFFRSIRCIAILLLILKDNDNASNINPYSKKLLSR